MPTSSGGETGMVKGNNPVSVEEISGRPPDGLACQDLPKQEFSRLTPKLNQVG